MFKMPPTWHPLLLSLFIWQPFNKLENQLSFVCNDPSFKTNDTGGNVATLPLPTLMALIPWRENNSSSLNGAAVVALDSLCPQFDGSPNTNLFHYHFLAWDSIAMITRMSGQSCHSSLHHALASPANFGIACCSLIIGLHLMPAFVPWPPRVYLIIYMKSYVQSTTATWKNSPPHQYAAPAAHIQPFFNGTITTRLPNW